MGNNAWGGYTSWDGGQSWQYDQNYHFTGSDGKSYYVEPGEDPNDQSKWKLDTMAGYHSSSDPTSGSGGLTIPENAYPWSSSQSYGGLPDWGLDIAQKVGSQLPGLLSDYRGAIANLSNAPALIDDWTAAGGNAFLKSLNPFTNYMREPMEGLAARGVFDSTMTRDALTNLGGLLADDYASHQAELGQEGLSLKYQNLGDIATQYGMASGIAADALNAASSSYSSSYQEDRLARYTQLLNMLLG